MVLRVVVWLGLLLPVFHCVPVGLAPADDRDVQGQTQTVAADVPCDDCLLKKIKVPEDFSGDLNALAELAYAPPEPAHSTYQPDDEAEDYPQQLKYGMKPGDELIGGQGVHERDEPAADNDDGQANLEIGEGVVEEPVHEVIHGSAVMTKDIASKAKEIESLTQTLAQLKRTAEDIDHRNHEIDETAQKEIDDLKAADEQRIKDEESHYRAEIEAIRSQSQEKASHLRAEEDHIQQRDQFKDDELSFTEQEKLKGELQRVKDQLASEETRAAMTEQRAEAAKHRENLWSDADSNTKTGSGLRGRLADIRKSIQDLRSRVDMDDHDAADLTAKLREEQHIKNLLDARLKNLHTREEAVKSKEEAMEDTNADLRHRIEQAEAQAQADAVAIAHNQDVVHRSPSEIMSEEDLIVSDKEQSFEREAKHAAQDEIKRLNEQLQAKEHLEAHAEQELIKQEQAVQRMSQQADEIEQKVRYELQKAETELKTEIAFAQDEAAMIVQRAQAATSHVHDHSKAERLADEQANIQQTSEQQREEELKVEAQEQQAKQLTTQLRVRSEQQMKKLDEEWSAKLDQLRSAAQAELDAKQAAQVAQVDSEMAKKIDDVGADWMASKIRADKDAVELRTVTAKSAELEKQVKLLKLELDHEKAEWAFQQLAQTQRISLPEDD